VSTGYYYWSCEQQILEPTSNRYYWSCKQQILEPQECAYKERQILALQATDTRAYELVRFWSHRYWSPSLLIDCY